MPSTAYHGKVSSITINGVTAQATDVSIDLTDDLTEITNFTSGGWKEFISGLRGGTFSGTAVFDDNFFLPNDSNGHAVVATIKDSAEATVATITGQALISSESIPLAVGDAVKLSLSGTFTGAITVS